jgi:hypothetical protein
MQLTAKLTNLLPIQTGTGKNGEWKKQDIIVETEGQYPKKVCISIWVQMEMMLYCKSVTNSKF